MDEMLPNTEGPKLGKFKNGRHRTIEFVKGLGSGAHSHVWRVKIDNKTYALKMFRHIRAEQENLAPPAKLEKAGIDLELLNNQLTPFSCETRAYGRLKETGNEDLAWKCYGYIALDEATYGAVVRDKIALPHRDWFSLDTRSDADVAGRPLFPIYALVKEFITNADRRPAFDVRHAHGMAQAINRLHSVGIAHRDIQARNYADSRIMDLSTAWTVPNVRLDRQLLWDPVERIDEVDTDDYFMFDNMIEEWNRLNPDRRSDYRMTKGDRYREVPRAPRAEGDGHRDSQSSEDSVEYEEIPRKERLDHQDYMILASSYDWKTGKSGATLGSGNAEAAATPTPTPKPGAAAGPPQPPAREQPQDNNEQQQPTPTPEPECPTTTTTTGPPPAAPGAVSTPATSTPRPRRSLNAAKLASIRGYIADMDSACDAFKELLASIAGMIDEGQGDDEEEGDAVAEAVATTSTGRGRGRPRGRPRGGRGVGRRNQPAGV
ncbi:hypothetical protein diail_3012 [Diaporthe ilicicola]|nr:hypothetical protein diail_3012 [Diaporthe ilicicola]